ncbi:MAG: nucleoside deaminase [Opitutales bacterium]|jgi:tRNA(Arg) A34 adenosine deaminase TadA
MSDTGISLSVNLSLPDWVAGLLPEMERPYPADEDKMQLALDLASRNLAEGTGGPFGAAIFDASTDQVISVGVNRVVPLNNSTAHAEMMAFMLAQQRLGQYRLDDSGHDFVLATSAQPCAMCFGASPWSGIRRIIIGATRKDVESLTEFDEGPLPANWIEELEKRGILVTQDVLRPEACRVLQSYRNKKGTLY